MIRRLLIAIFGCVLVAVLYARAFERPVPRFRESERVRPRGSFHVHSESSHDCEVSLEQLARAAAATGLDFLVVTDHNAQLAGSVIIDGITIVSSAELSTPFGHLIQLGAVDILPKAEQERLTLHSAVVALGGVPIIAHPADPKRPWVGPIHGAGGIEIANLASSARRRGGPVFAGLLPALTVYRLRPALAMAQIYDRDVAALKRWDGESDPRFVGLCGNDAHGRIPLTLNLPAWTLVLEDALPDRPDRRGAAIVDAIGRGRFHCMAGLLGGQTAFDFYGRLAGGDLVLAGDTVPADRVTELVVAAPPIQQDVARLVLLRHGEEIVKTRGTDLVYTNPRPGTYRAEVRVQLPGVLFGEREVAVLYSNRIKIEATWPMQPRGSGAPPLLPGR